MPSLPLCPPFQIHGVGRGEAGNMCLPRAHLKWLPLTQWGSNWGDTSTQLLRVVCCFWITAPRLNAAAAASLDTVGCLGAMSPVVLEMGNIAWSYCAEPGCGSCRQYSCVGKGARTAGWHCLPPCCVGSCDPSSATQVAGVSLDKGGSICHTT